MRWNAWVIQYDAESQYAVLRAGASRLRSLRFEPRRLLLPALALGALAALGALTLLFAQRRAAGPLGERERRYQAFATRAGARRAPFDGPLDHAARFARARVRSAPAILRFAALHAACRYGARPADAATLAELDALLARIHADVASSPPRC
jgi:HAMP domain-containing protein